MELIELKRKCPYAWHAALAGTWERIRSEGLLSTAALLDRYGKAGEEREELEGAVRKTSETLTAPGLPSAVIRDQHPLHEGRLAKALEGMTVAEWCRELNRRVFFWVEARRLETFLAAYADIEHDVLVVDARALADRHEPRLWLTGMNTGSTVRFAHPRGRDTFKRLADWPVKPSGAPAREIVELAVEYEVPDIADIAVRVERWRGPERLEVLWDRRGLRQVGTGY